MQEFAQEDGQSMSSCVCLNDRNLIYTNLYRLCGQTGALVGRNSTESNMPRVRSHLAAGAKYGEFLSRDTSHGFSPEKR